ncbi:MAG: DUF2748 family protein [Sphingobacteriia bacterium]|nr:DUF2748 family protein [Sphingobacteriia bacterium]
MSSVYHIIDKNPILEGDELFVELEQLAHTIVNSGKLRIDANPASNCIRLTIPELYISIALSTHELTNPELKKRTFNFIFKLWMNKVFDKEKAKKKAIETLSQLNLEMQKLVPLKPEIEIKIARIITQTIHPIVINLMIIDEVEIFVTYGHSVGDMLDIPTWQSSGSNSGMQSTDGRESAIFISCGGDPLGETDKENPSFGNGKPALARMMIIGAQEMGHFSDIKRDNLGRQISRYSANFTATRATPHVKESRKNDIDTSKNIAQKLNKIGLEKIIQIENSYKFYLKVKKRFFSLIWYFIYYHFKKMTFILKAATIGYPFIEKFSRKHKWFASHIKLMINDMLFNLDPKAEVYKRKNPEHEEAIACIEALARVPQQVIKWGRNETKVFMPNLYKVYYSEIIPGCVRAYETLGNKKYVNKLHLPNFWILKKLKNTLKNLFKKYYYKIKFRDNNK